MQVRALSFITLFLLIAIPLTTASASYDDFVKKGDGFFVDGEYPSALDAYDDAIQIDNTKADIFEKKALALFNLNRYREALMAINRSLEIDEESSSAKSLKEEINQKLGINEESNDTSGTVDSTSGGDSVTADSGSSEVIGGGNMDDLSLTQIEPLFLVGGDKEYRTYVPSFYECTEEGKEIWSCGSNQTSNVYIVNFIDEKFEIQSEEEQEFLKNAVKDWMGISNCTIEKETYNDEYHFYRMEGYDSDEPGWYNVVVYRLIDDRIARFIYLYPDQQISNSDQLLQDFIVESLEPYVSGGTGTL